MKTITFYSYKGGVGRSLALSNIAIRLSEYGKKVCIMDFDLDAPGLQFKFKNYRLDKPIKNGIVDYIFEYANHGILVPNLENHKLILVPHNKNNEPITFIPAGNIESDEYWKKLAMLNWNKLFYSERGQGIRFFLDLKAKIEKEIKPDILLIDSRTGINDISGITLKLFADEAVVLAVNNDENIFGSQRVLKNLMYGTDYFRGKPKAHFVLNRVPFGNSPQDKSDKYTLIESLKKRFITGLNVKEFNISIIHADKRLEVSERQLIGIHDDGNATSVANDYLKLFEILANDTLSKDEIKYFKNRKEADHEFNLATQESDNALKLIHINKAIALNNKHADYYKLRGYIYQELHEYTKAILDIRKAIKLNSIDNESNALLGLLYYMTHDYDNAINYFDKAIDDPEIAIYKSDILFLKGEYEKAQKVFDDFLDVEPFNDSILNARANYLRILKEYDGAYMDIYKAIEINPNDPVYFATLAEIHADNDRINDFYLNLNIALSKGLEAVNLNDTKDVYARFINDERFIKLMNKYEINIEEIMAD